MTAATPPPAAIPNRLNGAIVAAQLLAVAACVWAAARVESGWALAGLALGFGTLRSTCDPEKQRVRRSQPDEPVTEKPARSRQANGCGESTVGSPTRVRSWAQRKCCRSKPFAPTRYQGASTVN